MTTVITSFAASIRFGSVASWLATIFHLQDISRWETHKYKQKRQQQQPSWQSEQQLTQPTASFVDALSGWCIPEELTVVDKLVGEDLAKPWSDREGGGFLSGFADLSTLDGGSSSSSGGQRKVHSVRGEREREREDRSPT